MRFFDWLRSLRVPEPAEPDLLEVKRRLLDQRCENCKYFDFCDPGDPPDGYCCHPQKIADTGYGDWMNHTEWCKLWESK